MQTSPMPYISDSVGIGAHVRWMRHLQRGLSQPTEAYLDFNAMLRHKD